MIEQEPKPEIIKPENDNERETPEGTPVWGTAAGYLTGDPVLLHLRGHNSDDISRIQESIEQNEGE